MHRYSINIEKCLHLNDMSNTMYVAHKVCQFPQQLLKNVRMKRYIVFEYRAFGMGIVTAGAVCCVYLRMTSIIQPNNIANNVIDCMCVVFFFIISIFLGLFHLTYRICPSPHERSLRIRWVSNFY